MLAKVNDSTVWVAHNTEYKLERWYLNGTSDKTLRPTREWFPPQLKGPTPLGTERPGTSIFAIHKDTSGHLLVLIERARSDFKPKPPNEPARGYAPTDRMRYCEQLVETIDEKTGELLGTAINRTDVLLMQFLADGRLFGIRKQSNGDLLPVIWRMQ